MSALGARFLDANGRELPPGGEALINLARIDVSEFSFPSDRIAVEVACDVDNPLCGPEGASAVFGPQKGATPEMVDKLDAALHRYAAVVKTDLGVDVTDIPGAGAAGGLGAGLAAFLGARLRSGIDIVLDATGFDEAIKDADLIITGEGRIDRQTTHGKVISGILERSRILRIPVVALAGSLAEDLNPLYDMGLTSAFSIVPGPIDLQAALSEASLLVESASERVVRLIDDVSPFPQDR
jgi:glycerate kinase